MQGYLVNAGEIHALAIERAPGGGYRLGNGKPIAMLALTRVQVGEAVHDVEIAIDGDSLWMHLDGRAHEILWRDPVDYHAQETDAAHDDAVRAPMPGAVLSVLVQTGDPVGLGDPVMVIESMKLETTLRAPRAGVVASVSAAPGETFERGAVLIEIRGQD